MANSLIAKEDFMRIQYFNFGMDDPLTLGLGHPLKYRIGLLQTGSRKKSGSLAALALVFAMTAVTAPVTAKTADVPTTDVLVDDTHGETAKAQFVADIIEPALAPSEHLITKTAQLQPPPESENDVISLSADNTANLSRRNFWPSKTIFSKSVIGAGEVDQFRGEGDMDGRLPAQDFASIQYDSDLEVYLHLGNLHKDDPHSREWRNAKPLMAYAKGCGLSAKNNSQISRAEITISKRALGLAPGEYNVLCIPGTAAAKAAFSEIVWPAP